MRLWTLHPKYLDTKGLVSCWREGLLAQKVLAGQTKGYKNHPQLLRFKECGNPVLAICMYLSEIYTEAERRGYSFDRNKISFYTDVEIINTVTRGQVEYEIQHLTKKLHLRSREYTQIGFDINPCFCMIEGDIEDWEII